jgi:hypothetical protein
MSRVPSSEAHATAYFRGQSGYLDEPPAPDPAKPRTLRVRVEPAKEPPPPTERNPEHDPVPQRRRSAVVRRGRVSQGRLERGSLTDAERAELASWRRYGADHDLVRKATQW